MRTEVTTYFLEMYLPPSEALVQPDGVALREDVELQPEEYRRMYQLVGAPWLWYERNHLAEPDLRRLLGRKGVAIHTLHYQGEFAGYVECFRRGAETQILYFGLVPQAIGKGLGRFFLNWSVQRAFADPASVGSIGRLWVHTCSLDHPRALSTYHAVGFREYRQESGWVRIPQDALDRQALARTTLASSEGTKR